MATITLTIILTMRLISTSMRNVERKVTIQTIPSHLDLSQYFVKSAIFRMTSLRLARMMEEEYRL